MFFINFSLCLFAKNLKTNSTSTIFLYSSFFLISSVIVSISEDK
ncbi:sortase B protein-sorting domain-containing protein [Pedobacter sp. MC2016-14]